MEGLEKGRRTTFEAVIPVENRNQDLPNSSQKL
jgi:hypothetical protein